MPARGEHVPWLDELDALRREADEMLRRVRMAADGSAVTGVDPGGVVRIGLDTEGRVVDVALSEGWAVEGLAAAVQDAIHDGVRRRALAWSQALAESPLDEEPDRAPEASKTSPVDNVPVSPRALLELLGEVESGLEGLTSALAARSLAERSYPSAAGHVTVVTVGGAVVRVDLDERWLGTADAERVAAELRGALGAATGSAGPAEIIATELPAAAELRAITTDVHALLRGLGLERS